MTRDQGRLSPPVTQRDHCKGPPEAQVTLVEYGDYECSHCGRAYPVVKQLQERVGERLRFVFRNFPIQSMHPHAQRAAEAAEAAGEQGRFWQMHETLFENQASLNDEDLELYAEKLELGRVRFEKALMEHEFTGRVEEDVRSGEASGVPGTPAFFINGSLHGDSYDFDTMLAALEKADSQADRA